MLTELKALLHRVVDFLPVREENDLTSLHAHVEEAVKALETPEAPKTTEPVEDDSEGAAKDGQ
jgi:hypothetical protein